MDSCKSPMNRRNFLKIGLTGAAVTAIGSSGITDLTASALASSPQGFNPVYRTLGRTGLKITEVSFGAMLTPESEVIRASLDYGVNYIDTARVYLKGKNEEVVAQAIKGFRPKLILATKTKSETRDQIIKDMETSLRALETDYVDLYQLHNLTSKDIGRAFDPQVRDTLRDLKKQGKARFFGVTTHTNQAEVIDAVVNDPEKFFDTVLVSYNYKTEPAVKEAIARAKAAGIGVIAMKIHMGGYKTREDVKAMTPEQASVNLKWVLQDKNVTTAIPGMRTVEQVKQMTQVMGMKLTRADERLLRTYAQAIDPYYCRLCGQCENTCPNRVAISIVNRALMYSEAYHEPELAQVTYQEIPVQAKASTCLSCSTCVARCVRGLNISQKMAQAREIFA
jgi:uncharacterized protein